MPALLLCVHIIYMRVAVLKTPEETRRGDHNLLATSRASSRVCTVCFNFFSFKVHTAAWICSCFLRYQCLRTLYKDETKVPFTCTMGGLVLIVSRRHAEQYVAFPRQPVGPSQGDLTVRETFKFAASLRNASTLAQADADADEVKAKSGIVRGRPDLCVIRRQPGSIYLTVCRECHLLIRL